jgi:hypothetical protein
MTDQELIDDLMTRTAMLGLKELEESMKPSDYEVSLDFFYHYLKKRPIVGGVEYDCISRYGLTSYNTIEESFDIIMENSQDVAIIEVKYKAHEADLTKLLTKKYDNFKKLFPMYKDYKHHLVLATFGLYDDLKEKALAQGVTLLQRTGDVIESFEPVAA